jgi:hypothetical protein
MATARASTIDECLWPLDRRDELAALVIGAARIATVGPAERFEWSYADVAPALSARARASVPAVVRSRRSRRSGRRGR